VCGESEVESFERGRAKERNGKEVMSASTELHRSLFHTPDQATHASSFLVLLISSSIDLLSADMCEPELVDAAQPIPCYMYRLCTGVVAK